MKEQKWQFSIFLIKVAHVENLVARVHFFYVINKIHFDKGEEPHEKNLMD